jgi:hypothetical protein
MFVESLLHNTELTVRDRIRFETVYDLAEVLCSTSTALGTLTGSVALSLFVGEPYRIPDDFDLIARASLEHIRKALEESTHIMPVGDFRQTIFRAGTQGTFHIKVARFDQQLQDRLDVQVATVWPTDNRISVPLPGRAVDVYVEPFEWLAAHKLHALFKRRQSRFVSSRTRDLYDLAIIGIPVLAEYSTAILRNLRILGEELVFPPSPPEEWRVLWSKLNAAAGLEMDLNQCWTAVRGFIYALWRE